MAPGKTSPRLLQDLLTYDARYEERAGRNLLTTAPPPHDPERPPVAAVPYRNCRHVLHTKSEQSQLPRAGQPLDETTVHKVASYCKKCRWHFDVVVDFRTEAGHVHRACKRGNEDYALHHFLYEGEDDSNAFHALASRQRPRTYRFRCSAPPCRVNLSISIKPPRFSEHDIETLTNQAQLRQRWERAKQLAGDRADAVMARRVDAPDYLNTYLNDSLNPAKGKARIPLLNRKFLKTFGKDCDSILKGLGFTNNLEEEDDGSMAEVWYLPKPDEAADPLTSTLRNSIEDARYELNAIMLEFSESERTNCRHQPMYPAESRGDIERVLACDDYAKPPGRVETRSANHEEDHPYYASLGAIGDFADALVLFAFSRQVETDLPNQSYYFECLQDLAVGRNSEMLQTQVSLMASKGIISKRDLDAAYKSFGIDPAHAGAIGDDHIIGCFRARLSDISPLQAEEARRQLRILGDARDSEKIRGEAADAIETYEQAMAWFDLDENQPDDFVTTMFTLRTSDNPSCIEKARKALSIIAEQRQSERLRQFMSSGTMTEPEMDVGEAYALFSVDNRTLPLDLDVLQTTVDIAAPADVEKLQKAFTIIQQDQAQNFNNRMGSPGQPADARRNEYPLETWPVGLRNIGNTCYLNSVLQFLFTIRPLREVILNCDDYFEVPLPEVIAEKRVGRAAVTMDRVLTAQKFVRELRAFFEQMITAPTDTVQPAIDLASLALCRTDNPETTAEVPKADTSTYAGLGSVDGVAISGPMPQAYSGTDSSTLADSVMGDDTVGPAFDDTEDAKSDTSMQAMDLGSQNDQAAPAPPDRPPPIPPRPDIQNSIKIGRLEESARQQDAAEVMGNIFDLVSCAIKGEDVMREGEQFDTIKKLFYSDVTTVQQTPKGMEKLSELRNHYLVSPGGRDRPIYATLDNDFGVSEIEGGGTRYDYIEQAAPFQIINVRRLQFEAGRPQYNRSHIGLDSTLYMDRYLAKTKSLDELQLLKLREAQWTKQQQLREVEQERQRLQTTEVEGLDLADTIEETSLFLNNLATEKSEILPTEDEPQDSLPTPPPELVDALHDKAKHLKKDLEAMEVQINQLEADIDGVFKDCNDHPYRLHAVFTHSGDIKGGHYWIYIYDFQSGLWRSYNDDHVTIADEAQIFEREDGATRPHVSTGVVYVRADLVEDYTQAVYRQPLTSKAQKPGHTAVDTPDVVMGDANDVASSSLGQIKYHDLDVLEGVEKE
ncbi:ubiquitin C-terminal hydrolase-like protein [Plenodomus tracheiphilus IPT5]|uniref:ubiquitinyl hydrolase 1 n=1 Tax=Plenodomus tracheiphilus IPT5 TaxID=1408161 RepID=A0A6A7B4E4_9PLEO|nr:ubiquitin C-terminal hydrolase-like protein [Plenodomus tracheiphilus IPT5]